MDNPIVIVLLTLLGVIVLALLVLLALGKGSLARFGLAWQAFGGALGDPALAEKMRPLLNPPPPEEKKPPKLSGEPVRLLALFQREGRLLDFLLEDISGAADDQLATGVREIHRKCKQVLDDHLTLEPILPGSEGSPAEIKPGFDPSAIRLTGNVTGEPPFKGVLQHHGWRVKDYKLPAPPAGQDDLVVAPAEVDLP
jgi:hypothetical protein